MEEEDEETWVEDSVLDGVPDELAAQFAGVLERFKGLETRARRRVADIVEEEDETTAAALETALGENSKYTTADEKERQAAVDLLSERISQKGEMVTQMSRRKLKQLLRPSVAQLKLVSAFAKKMKVSDGARYCSSVAANMFSLFLRTACDPTWLRHGMCQAQTLTFWCGSKPIGTQYECRYIGA